MSNYWDWLANFGEVAGAGASNAAAGRKTEAELLLDQDRLRLTDNALRQKDALDRAQLEMAQKEYGLNAGTTRAQQAARGDIMANIQDLKIDRPGGVPSNNISGGLRPSTLGPNARAAGAELSRQALDALTSKSDQAFSPMATVPAFTPSAIPQASGWEKFLSGSGSAASLLGALLGGGGQGSGAGGNIGAVAKSIYDYFKNRNKPKGPDDMSQPGTEPGFQMNPDGTFTYMGTVPDDFSWGGFDEDAGQFMPIFGGTSVPDTPPPGGMYNQRQPGQEEIIDPTNGFGTGSMLYYNPDPNDPFYWF